MRWSTRRVLYYLASRPEAEWTDTDTLCQKVTGVLKGRSLEDLASMGLVTSRWKKFPDNGAIEPRPLRRLSAAPVAEWQITDAGRQVARHLFDWKCLMVTARKQRDHHATWV